MRFGRDELRLPSHAPFALERAGEAVLDRCGPQAARPERAARGPWAAAALAAATAAVALLACSPAERAHLVPSARLEPVALVPRGARSDAHPEVGIRLFRVSEGVGQVREANALELADVVTATYTDAKPGAPGPPRPAPVLLMSRWTGSSLRSQASSWRASSRPAITCSA